MARPDGVVRESACSCTGSWWPTPYCACRDSLDYRFRVQSKGQIVTASYTGIVPDTFKSEAEVVLKGTLTHDGFAVEPNGAMAEAPVEEKPNPATRAETTRRLTRAGGPQSTFPWPHSVLLILLAAFVVCIYAAAASVAGARRGSRR